MGERGAKHVAEAAVAAAAAMRLISHSRVKFSPSSAEKLRHRGTSTLLQAA